MVQLSGLYRSKSLIFKLTRISLHNALLYAGMIYPVAHNRPESYKQQEQNKDASQNGIFYGCNVTVTSNTVNITGGYGIVCGREFVINSESITVTLAPSGTLQGRLYVRLDLADADAPIQLLTATGNTLPALTQDDDVNYTNGVYEMELATFTVGVSALSDVVETFETIVGTREPLGHEFGDAHRQECERVYGKIL